MGHEVWEPWFAWRPVGLAHTYASCGYGTAWLCDLVRAKSGGGYVYALPGWQGKVDLDALAARKQT